MSISASGILYLYYVIRPANCYTHYPIPTLFVVDNITDYSLLKEMCNVIIFFT